MSGLIDAVKAAMPTTTTDAPARAAVLAVADWLDAQDDAAYTMLMAKRLRKEVAPPRRPTAEDVIRETVKNLSWATTPARIAVALRDAGMLNEGDGDGRIEAALAQKVMDLTVERNELKANLQALAVEYDRLKATLDVRPAEYDRPK